MLSSVHLQGFKSFTDATVKLAPLSVLIGANGSGKSNFLDALRIIGRAKSGMTLSDAIRGNPGIGLAEIRGGSRKVAGQKALEMKLSFTLDGNEEWLQRSHFHGLGEEASLDFAQRQSVRTSYDVRFSFLQLLPDVLRRYSTERNEISLAEDGTGFARLVQEICSNERTKTAYLDWLSELRPEQIVDVEVKEGAVNDLMFGLVEKGGNWLAAPSLSDGTLRFAALVAVLFQPERPTLICIEEIENGMHPARMILLIDLLRTFTRNGVQVIVTTHAPWLLSWLNADELAAVQWFYRDESGASCVKSLSEHGFAMDALKHGRIDQLFATGYLEQAQ
jgi:predicted ATPase